MDSTFITQDGFTFELRDAGRGATMIRLNAESDPKKVGSWAIADADYTVERFIASEIKRKTNPAPSSKLNIRL